MVEYQDLANYDAALKDFYGVGLKEAVNNSSVILGEATKNDTDIVGRQAVWSIHSGRSTSTSARAENGTIADADRQRFVAPRENLAYLYHTIKVSGPSKHLTKNDTGAFARALEVELDGAEKDLKNDVSRQVLGQSLTDGTNLQTGVIGLLTADPGTGTTWTLANLSVAEFRFFFVGMKFLALDPAGGAARAGGPHTITAIDPVAKTLTTTEAAVTAVAVGDYIVRAAGATAALSNFGNEINGLRHLINTTSPFAGITPTGPTGTPSWAAVGVGTAGTTQIAETVLVEAQEKVETDGDGSTPMLFIAEHSQRRALARQLQTQKRFEGRDATTQAGWKGLDVANGVLVAERYCPVQDAFALTPKYLTRFVGLDWSWDTDDGRVLYKTPGVDAIEARFKAYLNLVTPVRNAHCRIGLSTPA